MNKTPAKQVVVLLAEGFEEVEAVTVIDYCRRAGMQVITAACQPELGPGSEAPKSLTVTGSHGITVVADMSAEEALPVAREISAVVIPGGLPGAANVAKCVAATALIMAVWDSKGLVAAECAAPVAVLARLGLLEHHRWTCYPGMETDVGKYAGADWAERNKGNVHTGERVTAHGGILTSAGPGAAEEFSVHLVELVAGPENAATLKSTAVLR
jgi:4-methyl-5(b-hydroxyethyl)-thiazole monophosphate biosynthesis